MHAAFQGRSVGHVRWDVLSLLGKCFLDNHAPSTSATSYFPTSFLPFENYLTHVNMEGAT